MKLYQLIASACIACMLLVSCGNGTSDSGNHPAADTVQVPDTLNGFPIPVPDSTLKPTDTVAIR